jgi:hypothetical protein
MCPTSLSTFVLIRHGKLSLGNFRQVGLPVRHILYGGIFMSGSLLFRHGAFCGLTWRYFKLFRKTDFCLESRLENLVPEKGLSSLTQAVYAILLNQVLDTRMVLLPLDDCANLLFLTYMNILRLKDPLES